MKSYGSSSGRLLVQATNMWKQILFLSAYFLGATAKAEKGWAFPW